MASWESWGLGTAPRTCLTASCPFIVILCPLTTVAAGPWKPDQKAEPSAATWPPTQARGGDDKAHSAPLLSPPVSVTCDPGPATAPPTASRQLPPGTLLHPLSPQGTPSRPKWQTSATCHPSRWRRRPPRGSTSQVAGSCAFCAHRESRAWHPGSRAPRLGSHLRVTGRGSRCLLDFCPTSRPVR